MLSHEQPSQCEITCLYFFFPLILTVKIYLKAFEEDKAFQNVPALPKLVHWVFVQRAILPLLLKFALYLSKLSCKKGVVRYKSRGKLCCSHLDGIVDRDVCIAAPSYKIGDHLFQRSLTSAVNQLNPSNAGLVWGGVEQASSCVGAWMLAGVNPL